MNNKPALQWIVSNDTGISSEVIWAVLMGVEPAWVDIPYDASDFGRCYRLIKDVMPEWELRLPEVSRKYPIWRPIVVHWEILCRSYRDLSAEDFYAVLKDITTS